MTLRIVVRTDTPWATMTHASYAAQSHSVNLPQELIKNVDTLHRIRQWEKAYNLSYYLYRETIAQVCRAKLETLAAVSKSRTPSVEIRISDSVESFLEDEGYRESDIIMPIDDDDIFFNTVLGVPALFSDPATNLVVWGRTTSLHGNERIERVHPFLDTNNWAIHGSYLQTWPKVKQAEMLSKHQRAHSEIGRRLGLIARTPNVISPDFFKVNNPYVALRHPSIVDLCDEYHSVYYLHSGSISFLAHKIGNAPDLVHALKQLPLHPLFDTAVYDSLVGKGHETAV